MTTTYRASALALCEAIWQDRLDQIVIGSIREAGLHGAIVPSCHTFLRLRAANYAAMRWRALWHSIRKFP